MSNVIDKTAQGKTTSIYTPAEKQAAYRARQAEKRAEEAKVIEAAKAIFYWIERAHEQCVTYLTLAVDKQHHDGTVLSVMQELQWQAAREAREAKQRKTARDGGSLEADSPDAARSSGSQSNIAKPVKPRKSRAKQQ